MKSQTPVVSIVINAHNEGLLLHRTLKSINRNIIEAKKDDITVEVIVVADKVDEPTLTYINERAHTALTEAPLRLEVVEYGDLGLSRNHGIDVAKGEFIGNVDADDLLSENWITEAVKVLKDNNNGIVHPAAVLTFGITNGVWHVQSSNNPAFNVRSVIDDNWWPSLMMTRKTTFEKVQYKRTMREHGFSFEDWLFNCESLAAGFAHIAVPETVLFYRRKPVSMLLQQITGIPTPNELFTVGGRNKYLQSTQLMAEKVEAKGVPNEVIVAPSRDATTGRQFVIKAIKKSGKFAVNAGKRYAKPYLDSHHRVKKYVKTLKEATHTLIAEPNTDNGVGMSEKIPAWLRNHWYNANEIEPGLYPTYKRVSGAYSRSMMTMGKEQAAYWNLAERLTDDIDYILVLPYLRKAGAYMVGAHYVRAYKELHPEAKVVILTTESTYESDKTMVPEGVDLVEVPKVFFDLNEGGKNRVLAKLFTYLKPSYVHLLHSQEGFKAVKRFSKQVAYSTKIIVSTFNYDYTAEGERRNALLAYGDEILPYVTKVFTDNEWVAKDTVDLFGIDEEDVSAHAMPILIHDTASEGVNLRPTDNKMRVLWAARLAKQKRPDILYGLAKAAHEKKLPYEFVVYGELYDKVVTQDLLDKLSKLPNVQYRGGFRNGIQALPTGEFEVYLSTSEAEGTPNAILEAQERSLVVVAPNLGGIPEAIKDGETGYLVDEFDNVDQYLSALGKIYSDQNASKKIADNARNVVIETRSWDAFVNQLKKDL